MNFQQIESNDGVASSNLVRPVTKFEEGVAVSPDNHLDGEQSMAKRKKTIIIKKHNLLPAHSKLKEKEKKALFEQYHITFRELPKILMSDPAIHSLGAKQGDVIKIIRMSHSAGKSVFYRGVISG